MAKGFKAVARKDGTEGHNVMVQETETDFLIKISKTAKTVESKKGNPILGTTRGFVPLGKKGEYMINLNLMGKKN